MTNNVAWEMSAYSLKLVRWRKGEIVKNMCRNLETYSVMILQVPAREMCNGENSTNNFTHPCNIPDLSAAPSLTLPAPTLPLTLISAPAPHPPVSTVFKQAFCRKRKFAAAFRFDSPLPAILRASESVFGKLLFLWIGGHVSSFRFMAAARDKRNLCFNQHQSLFFFLRPNQCTYRQQTYKHVQFETSVDSSSWRATLALYPRISSATWSKLSRAIVKTWWNLLYNRGFCNPDRVTQSPLRSLRIRKPIW